MNKTRQQLLIRWLREQRRYSKRWLGFASLLGLCSTLAMIAQAWLLAALLQALIVERRTRAELLTLLLLLFACFILRAVFNYWREQAGFRAGQAIRKALRKQVLDRLRELGPAWIQGKPAGSWATLLLEQIEEMQDYYARYLPQMTLALLIPCAILATIFPVNWAAGLILLTAAPLIPLFMALVGMGAADANRRNFLALARLSGDFLDRLRGRETLRLFHREQAEQQAIAVSSESFRQRTMEVLRLAFLSSAVLEFFASLAIAVVAVYFGFSYLGELDFGHYDQRITLFAGFLALILAPEFFQPLRDLGAFYHAKAQATGGADALERFMHASAESPMRAGDRTLTEGTTLTLEARELVICTPTGKTLSKPLTFTLHPGARVAVVGPSGAGKTSLLNLLLGFLPYKGSIRANGVELSELEPGHWQRHLAWVGQNPHLPAATLRQNILLDSEEDAQRLDAVLQASGVSEFLDQLPHGLESETGNQTLGLSIGQTQRVAVARALYKQASLLLLDEPGASLDAHSEERVMQSLEQAARRQSTLMITHQLDGLQEWDEIWVMQAGQIVQRGPYSRLTQQEGPFNQLLRHRQKEVV
ncbi:heme ABC transporter permease/ATP-binding protein CydD [Pantoea sp.]|uniref:heme ABC transporter permease/ATP-binding protein CydD n=1 Tax=Pantoea sp. TaxID=69393 RepID=UPI00289C39A3|nr:cysteine/glutathione ABC transporter permease/ATP-binding protein CydD [Pantoea sp.]